MTATMKNFESNWALSVEIISGKVLLLGMLTPRKLQHCWAKLQSKNRCSKVSSVEQLQRTQL
jgi:hypothetical protein